MIVVIADDLSGAAEMAGLGWRFGLRTQVQQRFNAAADVDLIVVDTQNRAKSQQAAVEACEVLAYRISRSPGTWCYNKVDSVLRGHVYAELRARMKIWKKSNVILAPANPSRGRIISNGRYLINGRPLDQTDFANDPQHPVTSCRVMDLLNGDSECSAYSVGYDRYMPDKAGICVAEVTDSEDLKHWAAHVDDNTLAAGGADFFAALLTNRLPAHAPRKPLAMEPVTGQTLFVCGSTSESARAAVGAAENLGVPVCRMPEPLVQGPSSDPQWIDQWTRTVVETLQRRGCAIVAVDRPVIKHAEKACQLAFHMARLVECVLGHTTLSELFIEGGGTADAIVDRMAWDTLNVLGEYRPGVVCTGLSGGETLRVTIKPGSYAWPDGIWGHCKEGMSHAK
ncbi:MAG: four-carbon acid sugar kinase family protein [Planctomycetes bacterium]|nr:four-carbon acid sugar kinase family protein [Planctomycetota bacterium]